MKRLIPGLALVGLLQMFLPTPTAAAGDNTATTLFPVDEASQLETHSYVNCHGGGNCDFVAGTYLRTPEGPAGFPHELWARQTTEIRSNNRLAYLDAHATSQYERVHKEGGTDTITTVYFGEGPPDKYQTTGVINSVSWSTGQPMSANTLVYVCTHMQVVYPGVNLTTPSTCAQTPIYLVTRSARFVEPANLQRKCE